MIKKIILIWLFLSAALPGYAFANTAADPSAMEATIILEGSRVFYTGGINDRNIGRLLSLVKGHNVSTLVISSGGGEINEGMKLGEWVFNHQIDVEVENLCMSSCANYVFTAGRRKTIRPNSIVAWHGSILQKSVLTDEEVREAAIKSYRQLSESEKKKISLEGFINQGLLSVKEYQEKSMARQKQFFKKIGVDETICRIGNEQYGAKDFFLLSVKDMAKFGVHQVTAPKNYEKIDLTPFLKKGKSIEFVHLN